MSNIAILKSKYLINLHYQKPNPVLICALNSYSTNISLQYIKYIIILCLLTILFHEVVQIKRQS